MPLPNGRVSKMLALKEIGGARSSNGIFGTLPHYGLSLSKPGCGRRQLLNFDTHLRNHPRLQVPLNAAKNAAVLDGVVAEKPISRSMTGQYIGKRAVVIGAGPAGAITAVLLAKRGFNVKVFEKRSHPSLVTSNVERSIPLTLNPQASAIVQGIGATIPEEGYHNGLHRSKGSAFLSDRGVRSTRTRVQDDCIFGERHAIASSIIKAAEDQNLPNLEFIFDMPCEGVAIDKNIIQVGGQFKRYDLLVGADGVNSVVRRSLEKSIGLKTVQTALKSRYKSVRDLDRPAQGEGPLFELLKPGKLCFVGLKKKGSATPGAFIVYITESGAFQGSFLGTSDAFKNIEGRELEWLSDAVPGVFPKEWLEPIAEQLKTARESAIGPITSCSSLIGPSVVLLGDACHSITPTFGLGANLAIRDTQALDEALDFGDGDIASALQQYSKDWKPQVDSILALEQMSPRFGVKVSPLKKLWGLFFNFHVWFHAVGSQFLPWLIPQSVYRRLFTAELTGVQALRSFRREGIMVMAFVITAVYKTITALARMAMGVPA